MLMLMFHPGHGIEVPHVHFSDVAGLVLCLLVGALAIFAQRAGQ